ncbi:MULTISPECIES: trypsin-like peptidase domain-containing protein [Pseudidiomarina]|uniref:Serine protease DegS n=2 Tax=Pseudidiomarina TaxID=2800384 RepID=A0A368UVN8_9GAMM|nr:MULTISPECIES: trypsin-like peptidase domain-containing protein [Pseudidiomarina]MDX1525781.1 trypsin-like peptidase domain-containing protein [Pseudidiomarina maritima]PWW13032.1 serine protease DegS [Pseudidiomarina maritima]RBP90434.1 serine protease DegS [Pseudidiomarina tainanensis]RCW32110.1 serine protease DegS [Pseudidiomarina tainanensis]
MTLRTGLFFIARSVILGLIVAALVIVALPLLQNRSTTPLQLDNSPASYATAVRRAAPAVVNIYSVGEVQGSFYSRRPSTVFRLGSGVIMDDQGHILTAAHVVANVSEIDVALQDGRQYSGQVIGLDKISDLAVIQIQADNLPVIPQNNQLRTQVGDVVLAIGNPLNLGQTITQGIVSASGGRMGVIHSHADLIQMDAVINEGASGGALVNSQGYLVGINNARFRDARGQGIDGIYFAIPYPLAKDIMDTLILEGEVVRGYFGVQVGGNAHSDPYKQSGIYVTGVDPNSPADQAGLQADDFIIEIDGKPMSSAAEGLALVAKTRPGTVVEVRYLRANQEFTTQVTITRLAD